MNAETLREMLKSQPFRPFLVRLSSGEVHQVRHPECAMLTKSNLVITEPDSDRIIICSLLHITSTEALQPASA